MHTKHCFRYILLTLCLPLLVSLSGCGLPGLESNSADTIKVASQSSTESQIMAGIVQQLITHETDYQVELINNLGSSTVVHQAMLRGDADISAVRYTGTDLTSTLQLPVQKDPKKALKTVTAEFEKRYNQTWFPTYGFANSYAFMVTQATAKKYHLEKISDLAKVAPELKAGVDTSWMSRDGDGYADFKKDYGFDFKRVYPMQIGLVYDAAEVGKMDVVVGYSTDGRIRSYNLKVLKDDRRFFPPYDCSMVATDQILKKHPDLKPLLNRLSGKITNATMQELNYQVDNNLLEPEVVAKNFLEKHNYFEGE